jgi:hypothetical protein
LAKTVRFPRTLQLKIGIGIVVAEGKMKISLLVAVKSTIIPPIIREIIIFY